MTAAATRTRRPAARYGAHRPAPVVGRLDAADTGNATVAEFREACAAAWKRADRWVNDEKPEDPGLFYSAAHAAVVAVSRTFDRAGRAAFGTVAFKAVERALWKEARRQHPGGARRWEKLRAGECQRDERDEPAPSLDCLMIQEGAPAESLDSFSDQVADPAPGPEEIAIARELSRELKAALACLTHRERRVITLRYWGQKSQAAVATLLGTYKQRIVAIEAEALAKLRENLGPEFAEAFAL